MQKKEPAPRPSLLLGQGAGGEVYASIKVGDRLVIPVCKAWELKQCASLMEMIARPPMCYLCKYFCPVPSVTVRPFLSMLYSDRFCRKSGTGLYINQLLALHVR